MLSRVFVAAAVASFLSSARCTSSSSSNSGARRADDATSHLEEILTSEIVQQALDKTQAMQPVSLGDLGRQLRYACQSEFDTLLGMGGTAAGDAAVAGPPTKHAPSTETCDHYFQAVFPTTVELLSYGALDLAPQLSLVDAAYLDARLAMSARFATIHMDVLLLPVQRLAAYIDYAFKAENQTLTLPTSGGLLWGHAAGAARPGAGGHWPKSVLPMLVSHVFSGGDHVKWEHEFTVARTNLAAAALQALHTASTGGSETLLAEGVELQLGLSAALACQATLTDFAWDESEQDATLIEQLGEYLIAGHSPTDMMVSLVIAAFATYRSVLPLVEVWPSFPQWQQAYHAARDQEGGSSTWPFWQLWRLAVVEPRRERELAAGFSDSATQHECALASGSTSCAVRRMYEHNPYPKWSRDPPAIRWPAHPLEWLQAVGFKPPIGWPAITSVERPLKVLWVGCGTGYMLTIFARHFGPLVEIWALDLSLASLGYAARRIEELGLTNVHFVRGDITAISSISAIATNAPYDFMESSGVLHHLDKPAEALTQLLALLRPGAPVNLALYSTFARRKVVMPCRAAAKHYNVSSDLSVRQFRQDLKAMSLEGASQSSEQLQQGMQQQGTWASEIVRTEDYASLTGTRDLCLHPQEKTFTLLKLGKLLQKVRLRWLQFVPTFDRQAQERFEQRFGVGPFSKEATLKKWHEFEKENPSTFAAMYQFFAQRSCAHGACNDAKEEL